MPSLNLRPIDSPPVAEADNPHCSVFICGLDTSSKTTSSLEWTTGRNPLVDHAVIELAGCSATFLRYNRPLNSNDSIDSGSIPPGPVQSSLQLFAGKSGFLFIHDASDQSDSHLEESVRSLHAHVDLLFRYGGRGIWVVVDAPDSSDIAARFEQELNGYHHHFGRHVLQTPLEDACRVVAEEMHSFPLYQARPAEKSDCPGELDHRDFWCAFTRGRITPWRHKDYLRAAFMTLVLPENKDAGLLEVATRFATMVNSFKQRQSKIQLLPASRTLTVFWLYQVKLAIRVIWAYGNNWPKPTQFNQLFHYTPELLKENLPSEYYSPAILESEYSDMFWMLPDLRGLVEQPTHPDFQFRQKFTAKQEEDPDRVLRFAFAVVQRYLRPGESRRRSWFINLAFASLQQQTVRLRTMKPSVSPYSETQSYFFIQLFHAALSPLVTAGRGEFVQDMSYAFFQQLFRIAPSAWTDYYSPKVWDSLQARAAFVPPDLKALPNTVLGPNPSAHAQIPTDSNESLRKLGLIPEIPSFETLYFHQAIFLEDTKALNTPLSPSAVTTHAHLLKYIHTHILRPSPPSTTPLLSLARRHHTLLTTSSPLPAHKITFHLNLALHFHPSLNPIRQNPDYAPPPPLPHNYPLPSYTAPNPTQTPGQPTSSFIRHHTCPCHYTLPIPYPIGPNAVLLPTEYPYMYPQSGEMPSQAVHQCYCHEGEPLDEEMWSVAVARWMWERDERDKIRSGKKRVDDGYGALDGWEEWVRYAEGGLVSCWEGSWRGFFGRREWDGTEGCEGWGRREGGGFVRGVIPGEDGGDGDGDGERDENTVGGEREDGNQEGQGDESWEVLSEASTLC